jgi:poly(A) polymerase
MAPARPPSAPSAPPAPPGAAATSAGPPDAAARLHDAALFVALRLRERGHEAWFVGGCVRDRLLGRPVKDWDVATSAPPDEVQRIFPKVVPVGVQFGVCRVRHLGVEIEVATFRAEEGYADGRHPGRVRFTGAREDVLRRDFTINGLLMDPATGEVVDHVDGRADLARRVIRAIGDPEERFAEDRLRMLRAVRFAARLGFEIDPATLTAIRRHAGAIDAVSAERVRDELLRILTEGGAATGLDGLRTAGLLARVLPEVQALQGRPLPADAADAGERDELGRTAAVLAALDETRGPAPDERLGLAALLHRLTPAAAAAVLDRLRLPRRVVTDVAATVRDRPACDDAGSWPLHRLKRLLRAPHADTLLALLALEARAVPGAPTAGRDRLEAGRTAWGPAALHPAPLLRGEDFAALGWPRGPLYRELQAALETAQLDEQVATSDEATALLCARFGPPPESPLRQDGHRDGDGRGGR